MKLTKISLFVGAFALTAALISCGGSKPVTKDDSMGKDITLPCSDEEFHSDQQFFRGTGTGSSSSLDMAKSMSLTSAKANLAGNISTTIKKVTDRYRNERQVGDNSELEAKYEDMTREVVNQELNNISQVCTKTRQMKDGKYTVYIALEIKKDELLNKVTEKISKDDKLKLDYDKMKFENVFNEEMNKLAGEQK